MVNLPSAAVVLAVIALSYLLGSLNFAIIVSRVFAKDDVRNHGSGNAGMTNILRTYGKGPAVVTALGDFFKAPAAITLSRILFLQTGVTGMDAAYLSGIFVLLGHLFPVYFRFRGGKGVLVALGVVLTTNPLVFLVICAVFIPLILVTRTVSLGSVLGAVAYPVLTCVLLLIRKQPFLYDTLVAAAFSVLILIMHRGNIRRLLNGTENKIGKKGK